jgi:hypothetical protein
MTAETQAATPVAQRRRRASTGGLSLKLDAQEKPGMVRRFVNGDPLRIQQMEELGYTVVSDRAGEGKSRTDGMGTRITRHAGRDSEGKPFQAVLMETPAELYAEGEAEKESTRTAFEETIRRGLKTDDTPDGAYIPSRSTITHSG